MPRIKGFMMKKKHKEGTWGIKALQPGKEGEDAIVVKFVVTLRREASTLPRRSSLHVFVAGTTLSWAATIPSCLEDAMKLESPITFKLVIKG